MSQELKEINFPPMPNVEETYVKVKSNAPSSKVGCLVIGNHTNGMDYAAAISQLDGHTLYTIPSDPLYPNVFHETPWKTSDGHWVPTRGNPNVLKEFEEFCTDPQLFCSTSKLTNFLSILRNVRFVVVDVHPDLKMKVVEYIVNMLYNVNQEYCKVLYTPVVSKLEETYDVVFSGGGGYSTTRNFHTLSEDLGKDFPIFVSPCTPYAYHPGVSVVKQSLSDSKSYPTELALFRRQSYFLGAKYGPSLNYPLDYLTLVSRVLGDACELKDFTIPTGAPEVGNDFIGYSMNVSYSVGDEHHNILVRLNQPVGYADNTEVFVEKNNDVYSIHEIPTDAGNLPYREVLAHLGYTDEGLMKTLTLQELAKLIPLIKEV